MPTSIAGPGFKPTLNEIERRKVFLATDNQGNHKIDRDSGTWLAVKEFIKEQVSTAYMPTLRGKKVEFDETQYARGAMDALDSLLEFAGEEV